MVAVCALVSAGWTPASSQVLVLILSWSRGCRELALNLQAQRFGPSLSTHFEAPLLLLMVSPLGWSSRGRPELCPDLFQQLQVA